jgi:hypothetical protein
MSGPMPPDADRFARILVAVRLTASGQAKKLSGNRL